MRHAALPLPLQPRDEQREQHNPIPHDACVSCVCSRGEERGARVLVDSAYEMEADSSKRPTVVWVSKWSTDGPK